MENRGRNNNNKKLFGYLEIFILMKKGIMKIKI